MDKDKILDWLIWAIIILTIILFIWRIFGDSPTLDQLAVGALVGFLLKLYSKVDKVGRKITEHDIKIKNLEDKK